eukprot:m.230855 g.230855  ORF g.230855 m.230855 type:complete len:383 (-) comp17061_c0_seq12:3066-4214(-)
MSFLQVDSRNHRHRQLFCSGQSSFVSCRPATVKSFVAQTFCSSLPYSHLPIGNDLFYDFHRHLTLYPAYFLSHFHSDHYGGLTKSFPHNVYCSEITARLCAFSLNVPWERLRPLPMNTPVKVDQLEVLLLDANHCPGAVVFLFTLPSGRRILHTGDFRACEELWTHPALTHCPLQTVYLDTTYCDARYTFPSQMAVLNFIANLVLKHVEKHEDTLVVVGSYTIGKEKVFMSIAQALGARVYANKYKKQIFECINEDSINQILTDDPLSGTVHVTSMTTVSLEGLQRYFKEGYGFRKRFKHVLGIRPTGWTHSQKLPALSFIKPQRKGHVTIYGIPYSEHSSFTELRSFIKHTMPDRVIPTVNVGSPKRRQEMAQTIASWKHR